MTLLDVILLRSGWTPEQLGIDPPERDGRPAPLRLKGVIDSRPGRVYSQQTERTLETADGRRKRA